MLQPGVNYGTNILTSITPLLLAYVLCLLDSCRNHGR